MKRASDTRSQPLDTALRALRGQVAGLRIVLDGPGAGEARAARQEILDQIDGHVLPRLRRPDAPLLVAVGGSTGAGKSTLVNSLVRDRLTPAGVRRPTTRTPVLVCHSKDRTWFEGDRVLPGFARVPELKGAGGAPGTLVLTETEQLPEGVALLDTPDIDSVVGEHRALAEKLIAAADLWLYVTTAARYADAAPWELLRTAGERGATFTVVLNRVPDGAAEELRAHLAEMLTKRGLGEPGLFVVPETTLDAAVLPVESVGDVREWLEDLAGHETRLGVARRALDGALDGFRSRVPMLAEQVESQMTMAAELRDAVEAGYAAALAEIDETTRNGSLLRGEVLIRWQNFVGTGELLRSLRTRAGRGRRARPRSHRLGSEMPSSGGAGLRVALAEAFTSMVRAGAQDAAERTVERWRAHPAGRALLDTVGEELTHVSPRLEGRARRAAERWQEHVVELVRREGATKRSVTRIISVDLEGLALVLMVGLLGYATGEVAVAGGTSALPQQLLKAIFGAESLRTIAAKARLDLRTRVETVLDEEAVRFLRLVDPGALPDGSAVTRLRQASYDLEVAR